MISKLLEKIGIWGFRNSPYSEAWDKKLNQLLDEQKFTNITEHTAEIGGICVWIANHPYRSFEPYNRGPKVMPKPSTQRRALEKLYEDME